MFVGQGRAGKTAFASAIVGRPFKETASTVGITQFSCDVKHIISEEVTQQGRGTELSRWGEYVKPMKELEAALAEIVLEKKRQKTSADSSKDDSKLSNIVDFLYELRKEGVHCEEEKVPDHQAEEKELKPDDLSLSEMMGDSKRIVAQSVSFAKGFTSSPAVIEATPPPVVQFDEEMVMQSLNAMKSEESRLLISLFDYGGQSVFDVIHHLFLTRNGVYVLMFNMEWFTSQGPTQDKALRFIRYWLSSIVVHTYDVVARAAAPIVLVGTRLDLVCSPIDHENISSILYDAFSDSLAWRSVLENENGRNSNGKTLHWFFPIDNTQGNSSAGMRNLMHVIHESINEAVYTHKKIPLSWFRLMDLMKDTGQDCFTLTNIAPIACQCGVSERETPLFLSFLHDMGHLMWHDEPSLREVVVLDPISYLVEPATIIIRKLTPDRYDINQHHFAKPHRECEKMHKNEWRKLTTFGILHTVLLPILWKDYIEHWRILLVLMVKFGLLVPLRRSFGVLEHKNSVLVNGVPRLPATQYLVPSLLSSSPSNNLSVVDWTEQPFSSCYFVFTLSPDLPNMATITGANLKSLGFLPEILLERLVGMALIKSQDAFKIACVDIDLQNVLLCKNVAVLSFGRQRFRLVLCPDIHCVRVDVEGRNPAIVQQRLMDLIAQIVAEGMKVLICFPAVLYASNFEKEVSDDATPAVVTDNLCRDLLPFEMLIPLQKLREAGGSGSMLCWRGGRTLMSAAQIKANYGMWLQIYDLREHYDVFISYRWGPYDSSFTHALFDMFTHFSVSESTRPIEVFLDHKRLQDGRKLSSDFAAALTHSLIAVPIVSYDALTRMMTHSPAMVDNVLLEWIIILECSACGRLLKVFPALFGQCAVATESYSENVVAEAGVGSYTIQNFFASGQKDLLPKITPTACLASADELLRVNGISPSARFANYTVHSIVNELLQFLSFTAWDVGSKDGALVVELLAERVVNLLSQCDAAALQKVAGDSGVTTEKLVVPSSAPSSASVRRLEELSDGDVAQLMEKVGFKTLKSLFLEKCITGVMLSICDVADDLQADDYGVSNIKIAQALYRKIVEWKENGVPVV